MRHQYTPVFREFTTSSMWAETPATRCVWLYLLLHADPEGFVPGTVPGLAVAANVDIADTRAAIEKFLSPDPDSNSQTHEGRRLEKVLAPLVEARRSEVAEAEHDPVVILEEEDEERLAA